MCRRMQLMGLGLFTLGLGLLLSCLFGSWLICLFLGLGLIAISLLIAKEGC